MQLTLAARRASRYRPMGVTWGPSSVPLAAAQRFVPSAGWPGPVIAYAGPRVDFGPHTQLGSLDPLSSIVGAKFSSDSAQAKAKAQVELAKVQAQKAATKQRLAAKTEMAKSQNTSGWVPIAVIGGVAAVGLIVWGLSRKKAR